MRELKFKVWHKELKKMFWFDLMWGRNGRSGSGWLSVVGWGEEKRYSHVSFGSDNTIDVDPDECEIMQFTGLTDKNGKEIYEGDILSDEKGGYGIVEYCQPQFVAWADGKHFALAGGKINMFRLEYTEVIGNIYENPELMQN